MVLSNWCRRLPGHGENDLKRKVVVPVPAAGYFLPFVPLTADLPVRAQVVQRQKGEDYYVETFIDAADAVELGLEVTPAKFANIVCYQADVLLENEGQRSSEADWEIVCILASLEEQGTMSPLTMARNFLEKPGGSKTEYTAREFAEAIYDGSTNRGIRIKDVQLTPSQVQGRIALLRRELTRLESITQV